MTEREFKNPFPDYDESVKFFDYEKNELIPEIRDSLLVNARKLQKLLKKEFPEEVNWSDTSVYTGAAGYALLYMFVAQFDDLNSKKKDFLKEAQSLIDHILPTLQRRTHTFLCGAPGALAIASVLYHRLGAAQECADLSRRIENLDSDLLSSDVIVPDELLYGRAGYLYALAFINKLGPGPEELRDDVIRGMVEKIIQSGKWNAKKLSNSKKIPLLYEWHQKVYFGAAHGYAGILYLLLEMKQFLSQENLDKYVRPTIDFLVDQQFPSGNFPSSLDKTDDKLVHWCHGAPGMIFLLLKAYEVFDDERYLRSAKLAGETVWKRGLLRKGYGLCHGVAGNGYSLLRLFQVTKEEKYLYQAVKFAEWCFDYGKHGCRIPDRPLSLFEGLAGTIYYIIDLRDPLKAAFPAFQLS